MEILLTFYAASGLLLSGLSIPLILKKIPPNLIYGFRVPRTLKNQGLWYAANHFAGKRLLASGLLTTAAALGLYFIPGITVDAYAIGASIVVVAALAVTVNQSWRYLRTLPDE